MNAARLLHYTFARHLRHRRDCRMAIGHDKLAGVSPLPLFHVYVPLLVISNRIS
jgi:hypothetical protein